MTNIIKLDDEARAQRLQELTEVDNPTSLLSEIGVLRLLEEEALKVGDQRLVVEITKVIGQLSRNTEAARIRRGELLAKPVVLALAARFAQLLSSKIAGRFDGWEDMLDEIRHESQVLIVDARNEPDKIFPSH
jgi:hypothetical protein